MGHVIRPIKLIFLCVILLSGSNLLVAQPAACDLQNPQMEPFCNDACVICDIDGFTGRHDGSEEGQAPPGFAGECTMVAHNMRWIAFIAGSTNLRVELSVSNCNLGFGLEFGLYRSLDCNTFERISNCFGAQSSIGPGESGIIENTEPLVIGQFYYIVMDGGFGDNCDWTFNVIEGTTEIAPLEPTLPIEGEDVFCPFVLSEYTVPASLGATLFFWSLNGQPIGSPNSNEVEVVVQNPGFYNLCVIAANACDSAEPICKQIEVREIPETTIVDQICEGDCFEIDGNVFCEAGFFEYTIGLSNGCDSTINLELTEIPQPINELDLNLCSDDFIEIGGEIFDQTGVFEQLIEGGTSCDSLVILDLFVLECEIASDVIATPARCHGEASGAIDFSIVQGTPPFSYLLTQLSSGMFLGNNIPTLNSNQSITNLPADTYVIEIQDDFGNFDVLIVELSEPDPIQIEFLESDFNGFGTSCFNSSDGAINALVEGGAPPYQYLWSNGETSPNIDLISAGNYALTVTDANGCELVQDFELTEPEPLNLAVDFVDQDCTGFDSGAIIVNDISGGVGPYLIDINNGGFSEVENLENLPAGIYQLTIEDANMCQISLEGEIRALDIPVIMGIDQYQINLGDSIDIQLDLNDIEIGSIQWFPVEGLDCTDCLEPNARPFNATTYTIIVTSDDGCEDSFELFIDVEKSRAFTSPNIFSPNGDGINDFFYLVGSAEVASYDLTVYDRWGNPIYQGTNLNSSDGQGWDGRADGTRLNTGVYVWVANITFLDNVTIPFTGNVTIVR